MIRQYTGLCLLYPRVCASRSPYAPQPDWLGAFRQVEALRGIPLRSRVRMFEQAFGELVDWYHRRASISDGDRMLIEWGKLLATSPSRWSAGRDSGASAG